MAVPDPPEVHERPDPDALLAQLRQSAEDLRRGRLKIFFGASAGVGKTYAMLSAARAAHAQGVPLVVGLVETHGRAETAALLEGLPLLARKEVAYRERVLSEFDLDAALAFGAAHAGGPEPPLVLLDELAHSNAPGSRHPKRWQDIEELLAAGIDVWSTLNVQHLESLNDIVGSIAGVRVGETVPDTVFDAADEVVVVDLPPDELLARLAAGQVYLPEQAERAARHFFRKGNLLALRELALRRAADRADSQVRLLRASSPGASAARPTRDALLACVGPGAGGEAVVRSAARLAAQAGLPWHAVFIDLPGAGAQVGRERALRTLRLAQELGASIATPPGTSVAEALARYARDNGLARLVLGRPQGGARRWWPWRRTLPERVAALAPNIDVLLVPLAAPAPAPTAVRSAGGTDAASRAAWPGYAIAAAACALVALAAAPLHGVLELTNIVMLFLLTVVGTALRFGRGPAALSAVVGVLLFDYFFVPPVWSLSVSDAQYLITFAVMLLVALVIGQLTASLRAQARAAAERERRMRGLYQMSRELSGALAAQQVAEIGARFLRAELGARSALLVADDAGELHQQAGADAQVDPAVARWCYDRGEPAGRGTHTLAASAALVLPLLAPMRPRGALVVQLPGERRPGPEQRQLLDTCASLLAISLERIHYIGVAQYSTLQIESERLRNSLLSAISHDLRTPLAALVGLADTLALAQPPLAAAQASVATAIGQAARRMATLVTNLLDMARLQAGAVQLRREWQPLEEIVGGALAACAPMLHGHPVQVQLARDLPLLHLDAVLFERVLVNLLENAARHTPPGTGLRLTARASGAQAEITLDDDGPGLPPGREEAVFEKFERGARESATPGVGLGLALCRAIVQAHGGSIAAHNRREGARVLGARFVIRLPLGTPPPLDGSEDTAPGKPTIRP